MSLSLAKKLREKRANLHKEMTAVTTKADTENRALSSEELVTFDRIDAEINNLRSQIDKIEAHEERESASAGRKAGGQDEGGDAESRDNEAVVEARNEAFETFLRGGNDALNAEQRQVMAEMRAQSVASNAGGGYTVAPEFYRQLTEAEKLFGGMSEVSTTITTDTGATLPMPTANETSQEGEIVAENVTVANQDITFGVVNIGAFKFSSKLVLVSIELLQDSGFNISEYIAKALGDRIGRIKNRKHTVGVGTTEPKGIIPAATLGKTGANGQVASVILDDLTDLEHSVDPAYRVGAKYMFHDSTLAILKKLKDTTGRPIFQPGLAVKAPDTINGFPYQINQHMAVMAASAKSIAFGQLSKYFIRNVKDVMVMRLTERFADSGQVGFIAFARGDGNLLDAGTNPVKFYANSAT